MRDKPEYCRLRDGMQPMDGCMKRHERDRKNKNVIKTKKSYQIDVV